MEPKKDNIGRFSEESSVILKGIDNVRGIVAQALEAQFVEEGIVGQPLAIQKLEKDYVICYIKHRKSMVSEQGEYYFVWDKQSKPLNLPIIFWAPTTIPKHIWNLSISQFSCNSTLLFNIEKYLLPQFDSILDLFPYEQLKSMTMQTFLKYKILVQPIRIVKQIVYYFGADQILHKRDATQPCGYIKSLWHCRDVNMRIFRKAASRFQVGSTLSDCVEIFLNTNLCSVPKKNSLLDVLITKIVVSFERIPENENRKTFDYIRVRLNLCHAAYPTWKDLQQGVMEHKKEIDDLVIKKVENNRRFCKFGVPMSYLRLTNRILSRHYCVLEYIFELKNVVVPD